MCLAPITIWIDLARSMCVQLNLCMPTNVFPDPTSWVNVFRRTYVLYDRETKLSTQLDRVLSDKCQGLCVHDHLWYQWLPAPMGLISYSSSREF